MTYARPLSGRSRLAWLATAPLAIAAGALVSVHPLAGLGAGAIMVPLVLLALGRRTSRFFFVALFLLLAGYAFLGRGFAYVGVPPIYVGEAVLLLGCFALITSLQVRRLGPGQLVLIAFMGWGAARTVPFLDTYGVDALRDASVWGYAAFAIVVSLLVRPAHFRLLVSWYGRALPILLCWIPIFAIAFLAYRYLFPLVPGTNVQIPYFKPGDMAVHLAGAGAFILAGLYPSRGWRALVLPVLWVLWVVGIALVSALNRGGMLAIASVSSLLIFRRSLSRWGGAALIAVLIVTVVGLTNIEIGTGGHRTLSADQVLRNVHSIFTESADDDLAGTRRWREDWWDTIIGYTIRGPYLWDGKGYGINLAQDDGVTAPDFTLRAPHNAHLGLLARSGVPGLALWIALQAVFAIVVLRAVYSAAKSRQRFWVAVLGWIFVYWLAALINMSFDVYLEGPQGGIFFWTIMGLGLGAASCVGESARGRRRRAEEPPGRPALVGSRDRIGTRSTALLCAGALTFASAMGGGIGLATSEGDRLGAGIGFATREVPAQVGSRPSASARVEPSPRATVALGSREPSAPDDLRGLRPMAQPSVGLVAAVGPGSYTVYLVDDRGLISDSRRATFANPSHAPVEEGTLPSGEQFWRILDGGLAGWSYVGELSGTILIRELNSPLSGNDS